MIQGKWFAPGTPVPEAEKIRNAVFGRGRDALDDEAWNVVVWQDDVPAACGRLWWRDGAFCLGDVGVLPDHRHRKLGDLILRLLLYKAQTHAAQRLRLVCPADVAPFFTRLGFTTEGEASQGMLPMTLHGEDICLDTCKGCTKDCPNRKNE